MTKHTDGPQSPYFKPISLKGNASFPQLAGAHMSSEMSAVLEHAPSGAGVAWGIPFEIGGGGAIVDQPVSVEIEPVKARWLVFLHTSDLRAPEVGRDGFTSPMRGRGQLGEHAGD